MGVDLKSTAIDTSHALRTSERASQSDLSLTVNWSGSDDLGGSGIASATSAVYTGTNAHTYRFYSVATDNVGQVEPIPATFDAQTLVLGAPWQNAVFQTMLTTMRSYHRWMFWRL